MLVHQVRELRNGETVQCVSGPPGVEQEEALLEVVLKDWRGRGREDVVMVTVETHVRLMLAVPGREAAGPAR